MKTQKTRKRRRPISYDETAEFQILQSSSVPMWRRVLRSYVNPFRNFSGLLSFLPWIQWFPRYSVKEQLLGDVIGGAVIGIINVTQGIAYALLDGIPAVNGFYTAGPFGVIELMSESAARSVLVSVHLPINHTDSFYPDRFNRKEISQEAIVSTLAFLNGVICLLFGVFRLQFLTEYFSKPLAGGFITAAAIHVAISQLNEFIAVEIPRSAGFGYLFIELRNLYDHLPQANYVALIVSGVSLVFLIVGRFGIEFLFCRKRKIYVPWEIVLAFIATFVTFFWELNKQYDLPTVGHIRRALPAPSFPKFELIPQLFWSSVSIALVQIAFHVSLIRIMTIRKGYKVDNQQEMYAIGGVMIMTSFFPVFPAAVTLDRPLILDKCGATSQVSIFISALVVLVALIAIGPLLYWLPLSVLSVIVVFANRDLLKGFIDLPTYWRVCKWDALIWIVTFVSTLVTDVIGGLILGAVFQLFAVAARTQWPSWRAKFSRRKDLMNVCVFEFHSMLLFSNRELFREAVREVVSTWNSTGLGRTHRTFIFDCSAITDIDSHGLAAFQISIAELQRAACAIAIAAVQPKVMKHLERTDMLGDGHAIFHTVKDAIWNARSPIKDIPLVVKSSNPFDPNYDAAETRSTSAIPFTSL
ncbi:hypothetical protein M3Y98_00094700 [Aphelenchoides besseyi]|nr:hypothetical protein M3Y98_00094700 [Aphelenchoides besseyi]KAI6198550.1 hypothetical protein M3Y96_00531100 [Aphelenchoides besseyi]